MSDIFISYKRSDSADAAARIHDHLEVYFGSNSVFRDVDGIRAGMRFPDRIDRELGQSKVGIVVIGPTWVSCKTDAGGRRIDSEGDYVRMEIQALLARPVPIIPVLVSDAARPAASELPAQLAPLAYLQAISLPPTRQFKSGILEVVREIAASCALRFEDYATTLQECQKLGLVTAISDFKDDKTVRNEIESARELTVVMNDGRNFVNDNQELLRRRLEDTNKVSQFVFYHPASEFLTTLIKKNGKGERQFSEMKASFEILSSATPINLVLKGHHLFNPYSLTMTENYAFISPYRYLEGGSLPLFKFSAHAPNGYYHTLREDVLKLIAQAEPLKAADFRRSRALRLRRGFSNLLKSLK